MHYGSPHNGNGMRTTSGGNRMRTTRGRTMTPPRRVVGPGTPPRRSNRVNTTTQRLGGMGGRGLRARTGPTGRGVRRPAVRAARRLPAVRRGGMTQPVMRTQTTLRGRATSGLGNHGYRGVNSRGENI